jgi:TonB family protein
MKVKSQKSKVKSKTQDRTANTAVFAAVLTVFLHGVVFSVPAYLIYANSKVKTQKLKVEQKNDAIFIDVSMLPAISQMVKESVIKEAEGKKPETPADDAGLSGRAEKHGDDAVEKEMLTYRDIIKQKIQQVRKYPAAARQKGIEGRVGISFTILRQGALKSAEVISSSGSMLLDEEAVATIKRASPFPGLPQDYPGQEWAMDGNITFNMEE